MARTKTIEEILQELKDDYKSVLLKAVNKATDVACEDVYKVSMSLLDRYYDSYIPSIYERTDSLYKATVPIAEVEDRGDVIISTFGIEYDASVLEKYADDSYYDSSAKYNGVDTSWVIENFLSGIHPATNGSSDPDTVVYTPWYDKQSPDHFLKKYLQWYQKKFNNNVNDYIIAHITK
jgi:hypothetical protein